MPWQMYSGGTELAESVGPGEQGRPVSGPLAGLKVLDMTQYVAGPYCSMLLADLGADVIKVERRGVGDVYRVQGPQFLRGESVTFLALNRNKRSVALDLRELEDRERALALAREADVIVENSSPGTMDRLGIGFAVVHTLNPALVYCSLSGYGQTGPRAAEGGYDLMLQAEAGLMSVTGEAGHPPVKVGVSVLDFGAAMYGAVGILAAIAHRTATGEGQHVDVSLLDTSVAWLTVLAGAFWATKTVPGRLGSRSQLFAPYQAFEASDGWLTIVGTGGADGWATFCHLLDLDQLVDDPRFRSNADRIAHIDELEPILADRFRTATVGDWVTSLRAAGLPAGPINPIDAVLKDPQVLARDLSIHVPHPDGGDYQAIGIPIKFSLTPGSIRRGPPGLGEHQDATFDQALERSNR